MIDLKKVIRTAAGAAYYNQPIGTVVHPSQHTRQHNPSRYGTLDKTTKVEERAKAKKKIDQALEKAGYNISAGQIKSTLQDALSQKGLITLSFGGGRSAVISRKAIKAYLGISDNSGAEASDRVDLAYIGFDALVAKLMKKGKSKKEAEKIAAAIGRKKYGAAKFQKAAAKGRSLG